MANINAVITYNANLSPAQAQIKALTGQIGALTTAFNSLDAAALKAQRGLAATFAQNVGQIGGFTTKTVQAHSAVENFGKSIAANRLTMRQYFREAFAGYTKQNSLMKQLAVQQVRFQQSMAVSTAAGQSMIITPSQISAVSNATAIASQKFSIFNRLIDGGSTALLNFGKNTQWAGRQLMVGFTLPLALFTAAVSKQFRELDKELTRFQKVYGQDLGGAIQQSTLAMRKQIEQLAFDIGKNYGIAAKETAALAADIAATGAEGEQLIRSVQETTRLAVLGEVDRQDAMKTTLALQSAFKMNTDELTQSINFLNAVENQTSTTLQDFTSAIPRVGPVVQSLGGDIEDLAMMLVAMREGGVPAAEAANAIKSGLASLINPTQKASDVAEKFGINLKKIVDDNKGELMPTIYGMQNALQSLDSFSRAKIIEEIFGKYQFARMSALFENLGRMGSQTQSVLELTAKSTTELAGIANAELKTLQESTAIKFQRSLEQLRNTLIPIGETLTETLIPIFEFIGKASGKFIEFFQSLPEPVKNFAKYATAIAALAGPIIMMVGLFGNLIANGIKFGLMLTRVGARIAGLKVEKFELLNAEVMAAKLGVDTLTGSFTTQEKALNKLIGAMGSYGSSLRTLQTTNPALFVAGSGRPPIKRASGSSSPEFVPGSGRGDKIPAMLEPGEFVVNRSATQKYASVLVAMNRGNLPGFQTGTNAPVGFGSREYSAPTSIATSNPIGQGMARGHIFGTGREAKSLKIDGDYFLWHKKFWIEISGEENQLMNILQLSAKKNQPLFQKTLQDMNVNESMVERVMAKIRSGVMFTADEAKVAHEAMKRLAGQIEQGQIPAKEMTKALGGYLSSVSKLPQLTSLTVEKLRGAEQQLISGITSISATAGPEAQRARVILAEKLLLIRGLIEQVGQAPAVINAEVSKILQMASPSRVFEQIGRNTASGLINGIDSLAGSARIAGVELGDEIVMGVRSVTGNGLGLSSSQTRGAVDLSNIGAAAARGNTTTFLGMPSMPERDKSTSGISEGLKSSRMSTATNSAFAASMLLSTMTMFSGATGEAATKLSMFSTALMSGIMALQITQGMGIGGKMVGGVASAGRGIGALGTAMSGGGGMMGRFGGLLAAGGGAIGGGGAAAIAVTGGVAAALVAVGAGLYLYKKSLDEARERAIAAFKDPVETMKFYGKEITNITDVLKGIQAANAGSALKDVNDQLREAVSADYATLIDKIKNSVVTVGATDLGAAYTKMIISGMSAEEAVDSIKAIAAEAGTAGGLAYAKAFGEGLLDSRSPEESFAEMMDMIDPNSEYNRRRVQSLQADQRAVSADRTVGVRGYGGYSQDQLNQLGSISEAMQISGETYAATIQAAIQLSQTSPEIVAQNADKLRQSYLSLSTDGGGLFGMGQSSQEVAYDSFKNMIGELKDPVLNKIMDSLQNATPEAQSLAIELVAVGGDLNDAADAAGVFDESLARAAINGQKHLANVTAAANEAKQALLDFADADLMNEKIDDAQARLDKLSKARERYARQREKDKEAAQAAFEATQEGLENEIKALNKEQEAIRKSTDNYIKSLNKRSKAEDFYASQRQTSLGALSELASGNVFGFLQARQEVAQQAKDFAYQNEIDKIEERRDVELESIDNTIEKKQELIDLSNKAHDEQMEAFDKETEKQSRALDRQYQRQSKHVQDMRGLQDNIAEGQIKTYDEVKAAFGKKLADEYKMLIESQIKATAAELQAQVITGKITQEEAQKSIITMFNSLQGGTAYTGGTPTNPGGYSNAIGPGDYALLARLLGLPAMSGGPANRTTDYGAPSTGGSTPGGSNTPPANADRNRRWTGADGSVWSWDGNKWVRMAAAGGYISGPGSTTSDSIPARLSNGEYVVKASSVKQYGVGMMNAINEQRFAKGGLVQSSNFIAEGGPGTSPRDPYGKASPKFVSGRSFPAKGKPPKTGGGTGGGGATGGGGVGGVPGGSNTAPNAQIGQIMGLARRYQNLPYSSSPVVPVNDNGEPTGWGCATSIAWLYKNGAGFSLPHPSMSYYQYAGLKNNVSRSQMMPGDLIFYKNNGPYGVNKHLPVNHVEMSMGSGQVFNGGVGIQSGFSNHPIVAIKRPMNFAAGGMVPGFGGPRSDSIAARLSPGEYVMKAGAVDKYGRGFMDQINSGNLSLPSFGMPSSPEFSSSTVANSAVSNNSENYNSSNNVKIIINSTRGQSATAIANKVASMINSSNDRRNHSRSM